MGQQEVYDLLKEHRKQWLMARDVTKLLNITFNNATCNLKRLRNAGVIISKMVVRTVQPAGKREVYVYKYRK